MLYTIAKYMAASCTYHQAWYWQKMTEMMEDFFTKWAYAIYEEQY